MYRFQCMVSGGTFDHFHMGHQSFLLAQVAVSEKVLVGITSDAFITQHKVIGIESYGKRVAAVKEFLSSMHVLERVEVQKIEDGGIPPVWERYPIDAIAVTKDSEKGAEYINKKRSETGLLPLPFFVIPYTMAEDGERISSSRIRKGEIDRSGKRFVSPLWFTQTLHLPDTLRQEISQPLGSVYTTVDTFLDQKFDPMTTVSVGDVVTDTLRKKQFGQRIAVIDLLVQRKKTYATIDAHHFIEDETRIHVTNPPGSISPEVFRAVKKSVEGDGNYILVIDGEEDLTVLPFVLLSPLNFHIVYGQPGKGIVVITVTEEEKQKIKKIVEKFAVLASN